MKKYSIIIAFLMCFPSIKAQSIYEGLDSYFGTNLSGAEFAPQDRPPFGVDGTHYSFPPTTDIDYFAAKGLKLIRLPFRWERVQPDLNGALKPEYLNQIKNMVAHAQNKGVYIILDMHNFGRRPVVTTSGAAGYIIEATEYLTKEHLGDVWKKLAQEFKDYANIFGYDIMNEPYDMGDANRWRNIAQYTINAIREIDTKTPIIVSGDDWSSSRNWEKASGNLVDLTDPAGKDLIYQAHVYFDLYAGGSRVGDGYTYETEQAYPMVGVDRIRPFVKWLQRNNKKGLLGEYAIPDNDQRWNVVLENVLKYLQENGVPGTYWSAGPRWGDYQYSLQPNSGNSSDHYATDYSKDRPQMSIVSRYTRTNSSTQIAENKPVKAAPTPTTPSSQVASLFSDAYSNLSVDALWGSSYTQKEKIPVEGNNTLKISNLDYYGLDNFRTTTSSLNYLNFDIWTEESTRFQLILQDTQWKKAGKYIFPAKNTGEWTTMSIPLSDFNLNISNPEAGTVAPLNGYYNSLQFAGQTGITFYLDNVYFSIDGVLSSINDRKADNSLVLFPNPVKNVLSLQGNKTIQFLSITDIAGSCVKMIKPGNVSASIDFSQFNQGIYLITVHYADGGYVTEKVVKM
jgi:endoglucanase